MGAGANPRGGKWRVGLRTQGRAPGEGILAEREARKEARERKG